MDHWWIILPNYRSQSGVVKWTKRTQDNEPRRAKGGSYAHGGEILPQWEKKSKAMLHIII